MGNVDLYYLFFIEIFIEEYQYFIIRPQQNATSDSIKIFLGGVPLTTNVHYDPVGLLELPETPSRHSCSLQLHQSVIGFNGISFYMVSLSGTLYFGKCLLFVKNNILCAYYSVERYTHVIIIIAP